MMQAQSSFSTKLKARFDVLDAELPPQLCEMIAWLEANGQGFNYNRTREPFVSVYPVTGIDALWSHLAFIVPDDLVRHWFGKDGLEKQVIPFIRASGDGGQIALWRRPQHADHFVYLGSEGESYTLAISPEDMIALLAMGYEEIVDRAGLECSPEQVWRETRDGPWPEPLTLKAWVEDRFKTTLPNTAVELLPYGEAEDPFTEFCAAGGVLN